MIFFDFSKIGGDDAFFVVVMILVYGHKTI